MKLYEGLGAPCFQGIIANILKRKHSKGVEGGIASIQEV